MAGVQGSRKAGRCPRTPVSHPCTSATSAC